MDNFTDFNLHQDINKAISLCGYTTPTPVQAKSIPQVMAGKDVVVSAQTGTGKTASFVLPALHSLSQQPSNKKTRILILTPTRELASQITKASSIYGKYIPIRFASLVGGMPYGNQIKDLARGADVIVATPGRLMDHIEQKRVDLSNISMLVLDEADRMLDMGFIDDVQYIAKLTPTKRQTLLFSATLDNKLMNAVKHLLKDPVRIDLSGEKLSAPKIKQEMYKVNNAHHKNRLLNHFLSNGNIFKAIIFSATKINADKLADQLCEDGFSAAALHGDLRQNVRNRTLEQLRRGKIQYLVATDVAARGIDISDITHVFNYDLPRFCEDYVHRIGRTGRAGKEGMAISFVSPSDLKLFQSIQRYTGQRINLLNDVDLGEISNDKPRQFAKPAEDNDFFERKSSPRKFSGKRDYDRSDKKEFFGKKSSDKTSPKFESSRRFKDDSSRFSRDDKETRFPRGDKEARFSRDDNKEARFPRGDKEARFPRGDKEARFSRGDNKEARFPRSDKETRFSRDDNKEARFPRGDKESRFSRGDKESRFSRGDKESRFSRDESRGEKPRSPARVEFRDSNRKSEAGSNTVKVEFKESNRKSKFEKNDGPRKNARSSKPTSDNFSKRKKFSSDSRDSGSRSKKKFAS